MKSPFSTGHLRRARISPRGAPCRGAPADVESLGTSDSSGASELMMIGRWASWVGDGVFVYVRFKQMTGF